MKSTGYGATSVVFSLVALMLLALVPAPTAAQNYLTATGTPTFSAPEPAEYGFVESANGNLHLEFPLGSFLQRASKTPYTPKLIYDSHIWQVYTSGCCGLAWNKTSNGNLLETGWSYAAATSGMLTENDYGWLVCGTDFTWTDGFATTHFFPLPTVETTSSNPGQCPTSVDAFATDSSGFHLYDNFAASTIKIYAPDGTMVYENGHEIDSQGHIVVAKDANGNYFSETDDTNSWVLDTLERIPSKTTVCGPGGGQCYAIANSQADTSRSNYVVSEATIAVNTAFGQSGVTEYSGSINVIQGITLPDGSSFSFKYDCDSSLNSQACSSPHGQTAYYGVMTSMTLPTGGTVTYNYTTFTDSYSNKTRWLSSKYSSGYSSFTPQVLSTCSSSQVGCQQKVTVVKPNGGSAVYTFTLDNGAWPTQVLEYDPQGNLMSTTNTTWDFSNSCALHGCYGHNYIRKLSESVTIPMPAGSSLTKKTAYTYDSPQQGNVTGAKEWKFLPGASPSFPSIPDRARYMTYYSAGTNIINKPLSITLCNNTGSDPYCTGGGSKVTQTLITYDSYGAGLTLISGVANHDDTNFGTAYTARANPTQIQQWVSGSTYLTTQNTYDTTGQVIRTTDPASNPIVLTYADNFYTETGASSISPFTPTYPTNAYPKTITDGAFISTLGYYFGSGKEAVSIDPNNLTTSYFFWDNSSSGPGFDRPTETLYPVGWALTNYTSATEADTYAPVADASASQSCSSCQHKQINFDSWGRKVNQKLVNVPLGAVNVDTNYDGANRVISKSHAYVNTTDPSHVFETFAYDGLDRQIEVTHPDSQSSFQGYGPGAANLAGVTTQQSSTSTYGYGYPVASIDEAGKQKQQWIDGFGQIIEVDEPSTNVASPGKGSLTVSGSEQSVTLDPCEPIGAGSCPYTVYDSGSVTVTINGFKAVANYGSTDTSATVAGSLYGALNSASSPVTAVLNGSTISMTAKGPGTSTNYTFSSSSTYNTSNFNYPSFTGTSGSLTGGSGGISASPLVTTYIYDAANHLKQVTQGVQTRTFVYDGLGRVTSRTTPETGSESFSYVNSSNAVCVGDPRAVCSKFDARGVTTTYSYDSHNRLLGKVYTIPQGSSVASIPPLCVPVGTSLPPQNVCYNYDQGGAAAYALGRLTQVQYSINYQSIGSDTYTYDVGGRMTQIQTAFGGMNWTTKYGYNTAGQLTSTTYPSSRVVTQNLDSIGRLSGVTDGTTNYTSNFFYNAAQQVTGFNLGNGLTASLGYDPLSTMMNCLDYSTTSRSGTCAHDTTTKFGLSYYYQYNSSNCTGGVPGNNGQINCIVDNTPDSGMDLGHEGRTVGYSYDTLGRLLAAKTTGSTQYPQWGLGFNYDRYGNRTSQSISAGCVAPMTCPTNSLSFASPSGGALTNRPDGYSFDASGNMLNDGSNTLTYDAENRLITNTNSSTGTTTYYYDGHGQRIAKSTTSLITVYVFANGTDIAEYGYENPITQPTVEYIYSGGRLAATITGSTYTYPLADHLSIRMTTDSSGNKIGEQGHFPFGESWYTANTTSKFFFTSYERDSESGNDYAMARFYISRFGRFSCADPLQGRAPDPQSWNRYAYVRNNPVNTADPSGQSWLFKLIGGFLTALGSLTGQPWLVQLGMGLSGAGWYAQTIPGGTGLGTPPTFPTGAPQISPQELALGAKYATPPFLQPGTAYYDPALDTSSNGDPGPPSDQVSQLRLKLKSDCLDSNGRFLDYVLTNVVTNKPPIGQYTVTEHFRDWAGPGAGPQTSDGPNQFNDMQGHMMGLPGETMNSLQHFTISGSGITDNPIIPVRWTSGQDFGELGIWRKNDSGPYATVFVNGTQAATKAPAGSKCPDDPW